MHSPLLTCITLHAACKAPRLPYNPKILSTWTERGCLNIAGCHAASAASYLATLQSVSSSSSKLFHQASPHCYCHTSHPSCRSSTAYQRSCQGCCGRQKLCCSWSTQSKHGVRQQDRNQVAPIPLTHHGMPECLSVERHSGSFTPVVLQCWAQS